MNDESVERMKIIAHRGACSIAPENTLAAAEKAHEWGADLWETDVSVTRDGQLVLFHDRILDRTTDAKTVFPGRKSFCLAEFSMEELSGLNTGEPFINADPFGTIRKGQIDPASLDAMKSVKIPTLEQGLSLTKERNWVVNLELKETVETVPPFPYVEKVVDTIRASGIPSQSVKISSFCHRWLEETRRLAPEIEVQALIAPEMIQIALDPDSPFETFNIDQALIDQKIMNRLLLHGKTVNTYTVNSVKKAEKLQKMGVKGVFSDYPQVLAPLFQG